MRHGIRANAFVELLARHLERVYSARLAPRPITTSTGMPGLDEFTRGLHRGELVVVAGPAESGRTALALGAAFATPEAAGWVLYISGRESVLGLARRMVSMRSGLSLAQLARAEIAGQDWTKLANACGEVSRRKILVDDGLALDDDEPLRAHHRALAAEGGVALVIVDDVSGAHSPSLGERLRALAGDWQVPVLLVCETGAEARTPGRVLRDLRGQGVPDRDVDTLLLLQPLPRAEAASSSVEMPIEVMKAEQGPTGVVTARFDRQTCAWALPPSAPPDELMPAHDDDDELEPEDEPLWTPPPDTDR